MKRPIRWFPHQPPDDDDERPQITLSDTRAICIEALRYMSEHTSSRLQQSRAKAALASMGERE